MCQAFAHGMTPVTGPPPASKIYRFTTDAERERRMAAIRREMTKENLDAVVICGRDDIRYRGRSFYFSDVWQLVAESHVVILKEGNPVFIAGQVFGLEQAELSDWVTDCRINGNSGEELALVLRDYQVADGKIGVVGLTDSSFAAWHLNIMSEGAPDATFVDATEMFERVRQNGHSEENLEKFRDTSHVMNQIYSELEAIIRPRMTEMELASEAHKVSRAHGLRDPMVLMQTTPFGAISFGTSKQILADDVVCLWIESAGPSGHWLEYRRCYTFGKPSNHAREFWELQKSAVTEGLKKLKPGAMASEFVLAAQGELKKGGYDLGFKDNADTHFMFSLHGIGTDAIQGVWVPGNDRVIAENEVVNIHPTIEFTNHDDLEKFAWLGVTDNAMATSDGGVLMTHAEDMKDGFIQL